MRASHTEKEILHGHLFCGLGGGAKGMNRSSAQAGNMIAKFRCAGGIDVDAAGLRDFEKLAGVPGTLLDMFSREQYIAFHGHEPPADWREAAPADIHRAFSHERPHILFLSAPCKGFSGLLSETQSRTDKYQALNGLTLRGIWLALEAFRDDPVELIVFENVPRIATRGRHLLDQIIALLRAYGYVARETQHDCGELGELAQSRKRFLLVARYLPKVPNFLYEPLRHPLRGVGTVLERLPLPLSGIGGPMHRMPALQWKTWVRLAFVRAGSDWRSLNDLRVEDGRLLDFGIVPDRDLRSAALGVTEWTAPAGSVIGESFPSNGRFAVADPRNPDPLRGGSLGVREWQEPAPTISSRGFPMNGAYSVADPRFAGKRFNNIFRIVPWDAPAPAVAGPGGPANGLAVADPRTGYGEATRKNVIRVTPWEENAGTVTGGHSPSNGAMAVADPRYQNWHPGASSAKLRVSDWDKPIYTVTGSQQVGSGALSVADPRPTALNSESRNAYLTGGHYGVVGWEEPSKAVPGHAKNNNGAWSVADPRTPETSEKYSADYSLPAADERLVCVIRALDGTWHRPFTTLELAALQSLIDPEEMIELDGLSDSAWRERIGNAVPPKSATAIGNVMGRTLLLAWSGETFALSNEDVWVRPMTAALMAADIGDAPC